MDAELDALTRINIDDVITGIGLQHAPGWRRIVAQACRMPARRLARRVLAFDREVGQRGLCASGRSGLDRFSTSCTAFDAHLVPRAGPLLLTANHPGLTDALMVFANVPRADLRVVATDRSFLQSLPNISRHLIFVDPGRKERRVRAIRAALEHLQRGGALLLFPAGAIEPDPALHPLDSRVALAEWSASIDLLARARPETRIVPVLISGVLNPRAQASRLALLRTRRKDREWLGATLQLLLPWYRRAQAQIRFGQPLRADAVAPGDAPRATTGLVIQEMQRLLGTLRG